MPLIEELFGPPRECVFVGLSDVVSVEQGSVVVLGVRHGLQPDLIRVDRVLRRLEADGLEVTLAVDLLLEDQQGVLDAWRGGQIANGGLPDALGWATRTGFDWDGYAPWFEDRSRPFVAAGVDPSWRPDADAVVPTSFDRYQAAVDAMGGHEVPARRQEAFLRAMSAQDARIADLALNRWPGVGVLVVVVDRFRVEGGDAVPDALSRAIDRPVQATIVTDHGSPCLASDRVWR